MTCDVNVPKGRSVLLSVRNDANTSWEALGGISSVSVSFANNTVDITSQSTVGDFSEKQFDGYTDLTVSGDYFADQRVGAINPETGYTVVGSDRLIDIQLQPERCGLFQIIHPDYIIEGEFSLASFESNNGGIKGAVQGTISLESRNAVTINKI